MQFLRDENTVMSFIWLYINLQYIQHNIEDSDIEFSFLR